MIIKMNIENLQKMADYIRTVPQELFDMDDFRTGDTHAAECGSIGCVIGHCTVLDHDNIKQYYLTKITGINFVSWGFDFAGFNQIDGYNLWCWCFSADWKDVDNTPTGAALRIEWLIKNGLPENWEDQIEGIDPLCYL